MSRQNAVKHGLWAKALPYIRSGPLCESEEEWDEFRDAIIEELGPRTALELVQATVIANLAWRVAVRGPRWETSALAGDHWRPRSRVGWHERDFLAQRAREVDEAVATLRQIGSPDLTPEDLERALTEVFYLCPDDEELLPEWRPAEGLRPDTAGGWRDLIKRLLPLAGGSLEVVSDKLEQLAGRFRAAEREAADVETAAAVRMVLDGGLVDRLGSVQTRLSRELARALREYRDLREVDDE